MYRLAPKIMDVTVDTFFSFDSHACDYVKRASRALNVMNAFIGSSCSFSTETLVATYKTSVRPVLNHVAPSGSYKYPQPT